MSRFAMLMCAAFVAFGAIAVSDDASAAAKKQPPPTASRPTDCAVPIFLPLKPMCAQGQLSLCQKGKMNKCGQCLAWDQCRPASKKKRPSA